MGAILKQAGHDGSYYGLVPGVCQPGKGPPGGWGRPPPSIVPAEGLMDGMDESRKKLLDECEVTTFRASGPGGQHRNRRESAVRLRHIPTGIVVVATERRSQHQNRAVALERLARRLAERRRKRRPRIPTRKPAAAAARRLDAKKREGEIKKLRRAPSDD